MKYRKYDPSEDEDDSLPPSEDEDELAHGSAPMYQMRKSQRAETPRQQLFEDLVDALWTSSDETKPSLGTFAACETVKHSERFMLPSFHVEGPGELRLALSADDTAELSRVCEIAPFGKGSATLVDTRVRHCWQVDAAKITFSGASEFLSETMQRLATKAGASLGLVGEGICVSILAYLQLVILELVQNSDDVKFCFVGSGQ